jgi:hypothetical protein
MKKLIVSVFMLTLLVAGASDARPISRSGFMTTTERFNEQDKLGKACRDEFGPNAEIADWTDIIEYSRRHPAMIDFMEDTGLTSKRSFALVTYQGKKMDPRDNAYFIHMRSNRPSRHTGRVIDQLANHLFELKSRRDNNKRVLCYVAPRYREEPAEHRVEMKVHSEVVNVARAERLIDQPRSPKLLSTRKSYREWVYMDKKCKKEFGADARIADWKDVKRMINSRRDLDEFVREADLTTGERERLLNFNGLYKSPKDKHFYMIFNPRGNTPNGVTPIDAIIDHRIEAAAIMHIRARILCFVP